jgi:heat shock protein HslJ/plastocyanin
MVAGSTGCNSYSATFAASLTQIKVNPPINTFAFCEGAVGDVERAYLQGLASAESYTIIGSTLQVVYDGGKQALSFVAAQPPLEIPAPTAVISGPSSARVGDTVTFNGSRSQSELPIVQYSWDFGDGVTASGEVVNHIYRNPGTYTLRLTIVDERGVSSSITMLVTISAAPAQGPIAVIEGPTNAVVGQNVTFRGDNSVAGSSPIVTYAWSVRGFQLSSGAEPRFTTSADEPGRYEVILTVTDQNGLSDSASLRVDVASRQEPQTPPTAVIEGPTNATVGQDVTFQGGNSIPGSTPIVVYAWSVNGVSPAARSADVRFTTRFDQPGQYEVGLTVTDQNGLSNTSSLVVTVNEVPPAVGPTAVIEGPSQAVVGEDVTFQGGNSIPGSSPIVVYAWGIDGVQRTSTPDVRFTTRFDQAGTYNVSLTVTDQNGLSNSSSLQVTVTAPEAPPTPTDVPPTPTEVPPTPTKVPPTPTDVPPAPPLEGTSWELQGTLPDARITAEFRGGTISGSSGCNTYSGPYTSTSSNNISVGGLVTTQMACDEAIMEQEQAYLAALGAAQSYTIAGNTLTIAHAGGVLTFQRR